MINFYKFDLPVQGDRIDARICKIDHVIQFWSGENFNNFYEITYIIANIYYDSHEDHYL